MPTEPAKTLFPLRRKARQGPELDLLNGALQSGILHDRHREPLVFREPQMPTGYPDLVAVYCREEAVPLVTPERRRLSSRHVRVLHHLYSARSSTLSDLACELAWSERQISRLLDGLIAARLVTARRRSVSPRPLRAVFPAMKIVAIEAKISDWREALFQAAANTWFASHSYVLLPPRKDLTGVIAQARPMGVGIIISDGTTSQVALKALKRPLPASYGSWLVSEWAIHQINHRADHDCA